VDIQNILLETCRKATSLKIYTVEAKEEGKKGGGGEELRQ
jgi:hypothetical protein